MVRLTVDLIERSPQFVNPLKQRELDVRGNKLPMIENLGATEDQFDTIDISDNEVTVLGNFPQMKRLHSLLCNNNKICKFDDTLGTTIPGLQSLILTNNRVTSLGDLSNLQMLANLHTVSLLGNPVTKHPQYRAFIINLLPNLATLDFSKVKEKERLAASRYFKSAVGKKMLSELRPSTEEEATSAMDVEGDADAVPVQKKPTAAMVAKIKVRGPNSTCNQRRVPEPLVCFDWLRGYMWSDIEIAAAFRRRQSRLLRL
jgi:U2 small nuclear ribonucleoprotein A'